MTTDARLAVTVHPISQRHAHFLHRVLQDAFADASAAQWLRRAEQLEAARPRPGDFTGRATPAELAERSRRLTAAAEACRARAQLHDVSRTQLDDTLKALAAGAAA